MIIKIIFYKLLIILILTINLKSAPPSAIESIVYQSVKSVVSTEIPLLVMERLGELYQGFDFRYLHEGIQKQLNNNYKTFTSRLAKNDKSKILLVLLTSTLFEGTEASGSLRIDISIDIVRSSAKKYKNSDDTISVLEASRLVKINKKKGLYLSSWVKLEQDEAPRRRKVVPRVKAPPSISDSEDETNGAYSLPIKPMKPVVLKPDLEDKRSSSPLSFASPDEDEIDDLPKPMFKDKQYSPPPKVERYSPPSLFVPTDQNTITLPPRTKNTLMKPEVKTETPFKNEEYRPISPINLSSDDEERYNPLASIDFDSDEEETSNAHSFVPLAPNKIDSPPQLKSRKKVINPSSPNPHNQEGLNYVKIDFTKETTKAEQEDRFEDMLDVWREEIDNYEQHKEDIALLQENFKKEKKKRKKDILLHIEQLGEAKMILKNYLFTFEKAINKLYEHRFKQKPSLRIKTSKSSMINNLREKVEESITLMQEKQYSLITWDAYIKSHPDLSVRKESQMDMMSSKFNHGVSSPFVSVPPSYSSSSSIQFNDDDIPPPPMPPNADYEPLFLEDNYLPPPPPEPKHFTMEEAQIHMEKVNLQLKKTLDSTHQNKTKDPTEEAISRLKKQLSYIENNKIFK